MRQLSDCGNVSSAAKAAGVDRSHAYRVRRNDPDFAQEWELAAEMGADALEDEAIRRAAIGVEKPITVAGKREIIRTYSDTLLMFLLKGARPEKYCEGRRRASAHAGPPSEATAPPEEEEDGRTLSEQILALRR